MSGVYIPGMEMPTSCWLCNFQSCGDCTLNNYKVVDNCIIEDRRDEDCPLIPVPDHGRLIDAGFLLSEYDKIHVGKPGGARLLIANAPTIIPAEEGKP